MTELRRWLDPESDARAFEREVLELARPVRVPATSQERVWQRVAALTQAPPLGGAGETGASGAGASTAASSAGVLGVIKVFAVGAVAGLALTGGGYAAFVDRPSSAKAHVVQAPVPVADVSAPVAAARSLLERSRTESVEPTREAAPVLRRPVPVSTPSAARVQPAPSLQPTSPPTESPGPTAFESQLNEEVALIREARARLRAGDLGGALATLEAARARFPRAVLAEEREALTIELLSRSGRSEAARERARAFLSQFPESSLGQRVRELAETSGGSGRMR